MTGGSSAYGFVIDLKYLNNTEILLNQTIDGTTYNIVTMQGGKFESKSNSDYTQF